MEEKKNIKVVDKRHFNPDGSTREEEQATEADKEKITEAKETDKKVSNEKKEQFRRPLPEISFESFVISLATSAQVHLGLIPNPATGEQEQNLNLAKQTIDIISMMEKKTEGNLNEVEKDILDKVLYDLRMLYVEMSKK